MSIPEIISLSIIFLIVLLMGSLVIKFLLDTKKSMNDMQ